MVQHNQKSSVFTVSGNRILFGTLIKAHSLSSSTNNLAAKVHALFVATVEKNGWPSRVPYQIKGVTI